jgi:hypothetical protein
MNRIALSLGAVLLTLAAGARAQDAPVTFNSPDVDMTYGTVIERKFTLYPLAAGVGKLYELSVFDDSAKSLRLHFVVKAPADGPTWALRALNRNREVQWQYSSVTSPGKTDFWSDEISGNVARVELYSVAPATGLKLEIDKVGKGQAEVTPTSIIGPDQREDIGAAPPDIRGYGKSVVKLKFVGDDGRLYVCTGFLLGTKYLMTNNHCIDTETVRESASGELDYDAPNAPTQLIHFSKLVATDKGRDYSLLRLDAARSSAGLVLHVHDPVRAEPLLLIQHPGGKPKQISRKDCVVTDPALHGWETTALSDYGHGCDTLGGSSGSPILDPANGNVIGLHHLGIDSVNHVYINRAVRIEPIVASIRTQAPEAATELGLP